MLDEQNKNQPKRLLQSISQHIIQDVPPALHACEICRKTECLQTNGSRARTALHTWSVWRSFRTKQTMRVSKNHKVQILRLSSGGGRLGADRHRALVNGWLTLKSSPSETVCDGYPTITRFSWLNLEPEAIATFIISSIWFISFAGS